MLKKLDISEINKEDLFRFLKLNEEKISLNIENKLMDLKDDKDKLGGLFESKRKELYDLAKRFTKFSNDIKNIYIKMPKLSSSFFVRLVEPNMYWIVKTVPNSVQIKYGDESIELYDINNVAKKQFVDYFDYIKYEYLRQLEENLEEDIIRSTEWRID